MLRTTRYYVQRVLYYIYIVKCEIIILMLTVNWCLLGNHFKESDSNCKTTFSAECSQCFIFFFFIKVCINIIREDVSQRAKYVIA